MGRMKGVLVYKDDDELDTGMQKVQPLPFLGETSRHGNRCLVFTSAFLLDEEIVKFKKKIESSVPAAQAISDGKEIHWSASLVLLTSIFRGT